MPKVTSTALVTYANDLPVAFKEAFKATNDVLTTKCNRCESTKTPTTWFITCVDGCWSCDQCPTIFGTDDFFHKKGKGGVLCCKNTANRACQAEALAKPVVNKAFATAKEALEEVDTALKHGVSLIKTEGYVTSAMEEGEAAPDWVPIPPKQAMFKAKAQIASEVAKMKSEGKSSKAIQAFICGEEVDEEEEGEEQDEPEEPAPKRARKEPTAEQLQRREERKDATRKKKEKEKKWVVEYPALKKKCGKMEGIIRDARAELLAEKDPDEVNRLLGEESEEESDDDRSLAGGQAADSDGE